MPADTLPHVDWLFGALSAAMYVVIVLIVIVGTYRWARWIGQQFVGFWREVRS